MARHATTNGLSKQPQYWQSSGSCLQTSPIGATIAVKDENKEKEVLLKLNKGELTRAEALGHLGLSRSSMYRHKKKLGIVRPTGKQRKASIARKALEVGRLTAAQKVIDEVLTFEEALIITAVHRTTLMRIIRKLKAKESAE